MTAAAAIEIVTALLLLIGGAFALLGSIGLTRLPDFYTRLHGPTKATTLGVGAIVIASVVHIGANENISGWRELGITIFLFITAPVTAHLLSKAALKELGPVKAKAPRTKAQPAQKPQANAAAPAPAAAKKRAPKTPAQPQTPPQPEAPAAPRKRSPRKPPQER